MNRIIKAVSFMLLSFGLLTIISINCSKIKATEFSSGWTMYDGQKYYYNKTGAKSLGKTNVDGIDYFFHPTEGYLMYNTEIVSQGYTYRINGSGQVVKGWSMYNGQKYYYNETGAKSYGKTNVNGIDYFFNPTYGHLMYNTEILFNNTTYRMNGSGQVVKGWSMYNNQKYYYDETGAKAFGKTNIQGVEYFFHSTEGYLLYNTEMVLNGITYRLNGSGQIAKGWSMYNSHKYYYNEVGAKSYGKVKVAGIDYFLHPTEGYLMYNTEVMSQGITYKINGSGQVVKGWSMYNNQKYYYDGDGAKAFGKTNIQGVEYFFHSTEGYLLYNTEMVLDGITYRVNGSGQIAKGWSMYNSHKYYYNEVGAKTYGKVNVAGIDYFLHPTEGYLMYNTEVMSQGITYKINGSGQVVKGWSMYSGQKYFFDVNGAKSYGKINVAGIDYFFHPTNGYLLYNTEIMLNGTTYRINGSGQVAKGWSMYDGNKYYYDTNGSKIFGKRNIDGIDYFFHPIDGYLLYNTEIMVSGATYRINGSGQIVKGWSMYDGNKYYYDLNGCKILGLYNVDNRQYYFDNNRGNLVYNTEIYFNGNYYYIDGSGLTVYGFQTRNGNTYYYDGGGRRISGKITINNESYLFDSNGILRNGVGWVTVDGNRYFYNNQGVLIGNGPVRKIIDVSEHQGIIDWELLKNSGSVDGVILRIGYTGYGSAKNKVKDYYFERNYSEARRLGIPIVGAYWYSCAYTEDEAIVEANNANYALAGKFVDFPIYFDTEDNHNIYMEGVALENQVTIGKERLTRVTNAFLSTIKQKGYSSGIYASTNWYETKLIMAQIIVDKVWVAHYADYCTYSLTPYQTWQYTSQGSIPGIVGNVDINIMF